MKNSRAHQAPGGAQHRTEWFVSLTQQFFCFHELVSYLSAAASPGQLQMILSFASPSLPLCESERSLLVCARRGWILNRTISIIPRKQASPSAWLHTQAHCLLTLCSHSASNTSWPKPPTCGHPRRGQHPPEAQMMGQEQESSDCAGREGGKAGESRTPDSRGKTEARMVIREGGGIGRESHTITSPRRTENGRVGLE